MTKQNNNPIIKAMQEKFNYKNSLSAPKIDKIVLNVGVGKNHKDAKYIENIEGSITKIAGQKPVRAKSRKSIAGFKMRAGAIVSVMVTLRGGKKDDFLKKLIHVVLPRVRDFRGIPPKSMDGKGNLNIGIKEQIVFPEISGDGIENIHGLQIVISTTAHTNEEGFELLKLTGIPFKKQ